MSTMPTEMPSVARQLHPIDALTAAWNTFKADVGLCLGAGAILFVVFLVGELIPFLNFLFLMLVAPALMAGGARFLVRLVRGDRPTIESLFDGFKRWATVTGAYWLQVLVMLVAMLPLIAILFATIGIEALTHPDRLSNSSNPLIALPIVLGAAITYPLAAWWMLRSWPTMFLAMEPDCPGAMDALKGALAMTRGNTWRSLGMFALMLPVELLGLLALCVGLLPAVLVCYLQWAHGYEQLRGPAAPAAADAPPAPTIV